MKKSDFKQITDIYLKTCREIILSQGNCMGMDCEACLFSSDNTKLNCGGNNKETLKLCEEAIKLFSVRNIKPTKLKHHKVTRNELKKFYTYLRRKYSIMGEKTNDLNSSNELENAIENIIDEIVKKALIEQKEKALLRINSL